MKKTASRLLRLSGLSLALPLLAGQAAPPVISDIPAEPIVFPHENVSDLRGIVNVFAAFRRACLDQPVSENLPDVLVPEGYQLVTMDYHWWGKETGTFPFIKILSKTGREDTDFAGGHPIVELKMPTDARPNGECKVVWKRAWDYPADDVGDILYKMVVLMDVRVSYYLASIRNSRPDDSFKMVEPYPFFSEWLTGCGWTNAPCNFVVMGALDQEDGIDLMVVREK